MMAYGRVSIRNLNNPSHWSKVRRERGPDGSNLRSRLSRWICVRVNWDRRHRLIEWPSRPKQVRMKRR